MSKERKTLKILSLILWVASLMLAGGCIHGIIKAPTPFLIAYEIVVALLGFYTGWLGVQGANTPSKVGAHPKFSIVIMVFNLLFVLGVNFNYIQASNHGPHMVANISIFMFVVSLLSCIYAKKVSEQVTL